MTVVHRSHHGRHSCRPVSLVIIVGSALALTLAVPLVVAFAARF
jgi:hypothetical protein